MPLPVSLEKIVEEIDASIEGYGAYLNRQTGEIVGGDLELIEDDHGLPAWMKKIATKLRAAASSPDWLLLPDEFRCETMEVLERFCKECSVGTVRRDLLAQVRGGALMGVINFKLMNLEMYDDWQEFRRDRIAEQAAAWLKDNPASEITGSHSLANVALGRGLVAASALCKCLHGHIVYIDCAIHERRAASILKRGRVVHGAHVSELPDTATWAP